MPVEINDGNASGAQADGAWLPYARQIERLRQLDTLIASDRAGLPARIERATILNALDRRVEARQAFIDILLQAPENFSALNEFGNLLTATGSVAAACRVYKQAIKNHPENPIGHINLANLYLRACEYSKAKAHYETALRLDVHQPQAHQGLGAVLAATGDRAEAKAHFRNGFSGNCVSTLSYRGNRPPLPLLQLVSSGDGNIPTASFLDDRVFLVTVAVADFLETSIELPQHRLIFNAIGDADLCVPALKAAARLVTRCQTPVINHPATVLKTGREANAKRLGRLPGVRAPRIATLPRAVLANVDAAAILARHGLSCPVLLRSPGFHTGRNFVLAGAPHELRAAAETLPGEKLLAIEYLDARGQDGNARKYRAMFVGGRIFPLHAAISERWKVHYFTADMDNPAHRAEDAAFINDMPSVIGPKAMAALTCIRDTLGLDYGGIDFGLGPSGEVLVFEANATMVVNPPDAGERWTYRRPAVQKILDAVGAMIMKTASPDIIRKTG